MTLRVGSLFSGVGGLDLGLPPHEHAFLCEADPHAARVLAARFPNVPIVPDVRELDASAPPVDVLVGGYPCQPFSVAGRREGENDPRHLWPEFARLVRVLRPRFVFAENVAGHLALGFDRVLADLAQAGFDAEWVVVRAADVGAPHGRARLFVFATDAERERASSPNPRGDGRFRVAPLDGEDGGVAIERGNEPHGRALADDRTHDRHDGTAAPVEWGEYGPAVRQWQRILGRATPHPLDDRGRLVPAFVEWMMGFPDGWVTAPELGVSRTQAIKMLGNAVVPQAASAAWSILWSQAATP